MLFVGDDGDTEVVPLTDEGPYLKVTAARQTRIPSVGTLGLEGKSGPVVIYVLCARSTAELARQVEQLLRRTREIGPIDLHGLSPRVVQLLATRAKVTIDRSVRRRKDVDETVQTLRGLCREKGLNGIEVVIWAVKFAD